MLKVFRVCKDYRVCKVCREQVFKDKQEMHKVCRVCKV